MADNKDLRIMSSNILIDNLACFLISGKADFADEILWDIAYSFHSHDKINHPKRKFTL